MPGGHTGGRNSFGDLKSYGKKCFGIPFYMEKCYSDSNSYFVCYDLPTVLQIYLSAGAIYSLFNKVSLYHYELDKDKCVHCGKCANVCQMNVDPVKDPNSPECIRCRKCMESCPVHAIKSKFGFRE